MGLELELGWIGLVVLSIVGGAVGARWILKSVNWWVYETKLGEKQYYLPPGDLGWPYIGNMWAFLRAFKSKDPDSFISSFLSRFSFSLNLEANAGSFCLFIFILSICYVFYFLYWLCKEYIHDISI